MRSGRLIYARIGAPAGPLDTSVEIPFSKDSKHVLQYTGEESDRLLHHHIGLEHLLLGLLRHERGVAWDVLQEKGLNLTAVREALVIYVSAKSLLASRDRWDARRDGPRQRPARASGAWHLPHDRDSTRRVPAVVRRRTTRAPGPSPASARSASAHSPIVHVGRTHPRNRADLDVGGHTDSVRSDSGSSSSTRP